MNTQKKLSVILYALPILLVVISQFYFFRIDLTTDKRYSISPQTIRFLKSTQHELNITVYLDGDLNPGFNRLKKSTIDLLDEMSVYANKGINIETINPSKAETTDERNKKYLEMETMGMTPTAIYERDKEGKAIQKIVFPWVKITYNNKTTVVNLLKNIPGNSGEENLNISIENLEFELMDGVRRAVNTTVSKIAFIEGHGELNEAETYSISKLLSRYFQIDRGVLANDATILSAYKAIIIAKPQTAFSESDKFIIDQYIMNGGRVLWLLDGVRISNENLSTSGLSPAIELNLNLNDQLFKYGVRINPVLLQDVQCVQVPVNIAPANEKPQFEPSAWYYAPLLLTSYQHPITKNIAEVRSDFASTIETVGENPNTTSTLLLASSDNSHLVPTPADIDLSKIPNAKDKDYFNMSYLPVAVLIEGQFESVFTNRMKPREITNNFDIRNKSLNTKQIIISDGDIIRNETNGIASDSTTLALGFDRYMNQQFGNPEFLQNAILYLTDEDGWLELRSRSLKIRLLNKNIINEQLLFWQILNTALPVLMLLIFAFAYSVWRKRKYSK